MATEAGSVESRIRSYFQAKTAQIQVMAAAAPICEHTGLIGSYREQLQRLYLRDFLPRRFSVGHGMIYGPVHRSREVDIVIWDELNYASLPLLDHSFFFAESVRAAMECKSIWSMENMEDVLAKCEAVKNIYIPFGDTLIDTITAIEEKLIAVASGSDYNGALIVRPHISTAAVFLTGGASFDSSYMTPQINSILDDKWPDIMILLESGKVVIKTYRAAAGFSGSGWLDFYELGTDALLVFTAALLTLLEERSALIEPPSRLALYTPKLASIQPVARIPFQLTRPPAHRMALWAPIPEN